MEKVWLRSGYPVLFCVRTYFVLEQNVKYITIRDINLIESKHNAPVKHSKVMFAQRDINKDEEILYDHGIYPTKWKQVGLAKTCIIF